MSRLKKEECELDFKSKNKYILIAKTVGITATLALGAAVVPSTLVGEHYVYAEEASTPVQQHIRWNTYSKAIHQGKHCLRG